MYLPGTTWWVCNWPCKVLEIEGNFTWLSCFNQFLWILIWCFWFLKCRYENVPLEINRLRCRVNYHALRFLPATEKMANILVSRMHNRTGKPQPFMYVHSLCLLSPHTFRQFELVRSIGARSQRMWFFHGNFGIRSGTHMELNKDGLTYII